MTAGHFPCVFKDIIEDLTIPLLQLLNKWLERMPFLKEGADKAFWENYKKVYTEGLADAEKGNSQVFDSIFENPDEMPGRHLSPAAPMVI